MKVNDNGDGTLSFEQKVVGGDLLVFVNKLKAGSLEIEKTVAKRLLLVDIVIK